MASSGANRHNTHPAQHREHVKRLFCANHLNDELQRAFADLDTFDVYTPRYERLRTLGQICRVMEAAGLVEVSVNRSGNGVEARGRVPKCAV